MLSSTKNRSLNKKIIIKPGLHVETHIQHSVWCIYGKLPHRHKREAPPNQKKKD